MATIKPMIAADFSQVVYDVLNMESVSKFVKTSLYKFRNQIDINPARIDIGHGKTGGPGVLKSRTAFCFVARGKNQYQGHLFIVFRGTTMSYAGDWLSNANNTFGKSAANSTVHDGFSKIFKSIQADLEAKVTQSLTGIHTVHCIGHSLGGALATLCAEYIICKRAALQVYLYSFGAPRPGLPDFGWKLTTKLNASHIKRVYHRTDPVPLVPYWPFIQVPYGPNAWKNHDHELPSAGEFPHPAWHRMEHYIKSVEGSTWQNLAAKTHVVDPEFVAKQWLNQKGVFAFTPTNCRKLNIALNFVLSLLARAAATKATIFAYRVNQKVDSYYSAVDNIAKTLSRGIVIADLVSEWVFKLLVRMMSMLGMKPIGDKIQATEQKIREILINFNNRIRLQAQTAIDQVLVQGNAA